MKKLIPVLALCLFWSFHELIAQKEVCKNIYVWDFTDENGKKTNHTQMLTQEVESALTETSCRVLQRRNYAKLAEQIDNENAIQSIEGMSSTINNELQSIKAETVLFGRVQMDFSGNIMLSVSFQNLLTKEILKSESLMLAGEDAHNIGKRKQKIVSFISHCVGPKMITNEESSYWQQAQSLGTPEAYHNYLSRYPAGQFKSQAEQAIADEAVWQDIQQDGRTNRKIKKLEEYTENPQSLHYTEARDQLENLLWSKADYESYKKLFPEGKYTDQVDQQYESQLYEKANRAPLMYADNYLSNFPDGKYVRQIKIKYEDAVYQKAAENPRFYTKEYMAEFPNGRYVIKLDDQYWGLVLSESSSYTASSRAEEYLTLFPAGKHVKEAKGKVKKY